MTQPVTGLGYTEDICLVVAIILLGVMLVGSAGLSLWLWWPR